MRESLVSTFSINLPKNNDAHCTPTEETLIDFRELHGEHSGENMAEEVWASLASYGLEDRVRSVVTDNAHTPLPPDSFGGTLYSAKNTSRRSRERVQQQKKD
ncbi:hypothetical protein B0H13DRAFT_1637955 [Mycena leptocephala]|nr:hypothetical protein B0H13DRAFT_1637955 [Mycena leptocephala]